MGQYHEHDYLHRSVDGNLHAAGCEDRGEDGLQGGHHYCNPDHVVDVDDEHVGIDDGHYHCNLDHVVDFVCLKKRP